MANFQERIKEKYPILSKGMKKVGKYVIDNPQEIAMHSASQLGQKTGVSETTVIRFCYALAYSGYSELQREVRTYLILQKSSLDKFQAIKEELAQEPQFFSRSIQQTQYHIQEMKEKINEADLQLTVNRIYHSDRVFVTGFHTSFSMAHWLSFTLNIVHGNVQLIHYGIDDINHIFSGLTEDSTLIAITFHRYTSITLRLAEAAKKQGAFIIGITDSELSPIGEHADILLPIGLSTLSTIDSAPAVFTLMNAIVAGVSLIDKDKFLEKKNEYEKFNPGNFLI